MTRLTCTTTTEELLAWWLGELGPAEDQRLDEHLFTCAACAQRLEALVALGQAIRRETLRGEFGFVASDAFIGRMKAAGLTLREYHVAPGGSVHCTIAPGDDFVVSHLAASLDDVRKLDVLIDDDTLGRIRLADVPFDPAAGGLTLVPSVKFVRALGQSTQRATLLAMDGGEERIIGEYTFHHSPW